MMGKGGRIVKERQAVEKLSLAPVAEYRMMSLKHI